MLLDSSTDCYIQDMVGTYTVKLSAGVYIYAFPQKDHNNHDMKQNAMVLEGTVGLGTGK